MDIRYPWNEYNECWEKEYQNGECGYSCHYIHGSNTNLLYGFIYFHEKRG